MVLGIGQWAMGNGQWNRKMTNYQLPNA